VHARPSADAGLDAFDAGAAAAEDEAADDVPAAGSEDPPHAAAASKAARASGTTARRGRRTGGRVCHRDRQVAVIARGLRRPAGRRHAPDRRLVGQFVRGLAIPHAYFADVWTRP
jgi:hypothetical protein